MGQTRSEAVAGIADCTASQHLWGDVTILYSIFHFLSVLLSNRVSIFSRFRDIALLAFWGHEFDLSGSRDVICRVTN